MLRRGDQSFKAMRHSHSADVADQKPIFSSRHFLRRTRTKKIGLHSILNDGNFLRGYLPMLDEMIFKCWRDDYDMVATTIEESGNGVQSAMQHASLGARSDRGERFRPEIPHFENKRHPLAPCQPPSGERNQQLWRGANDHIRLGHTKSTERRRQPK